MRWSRKAFAPTLLSALALAMTGGCIAEGGLSTKTFRLEVTLTQADGTPLTTADSPYCLDIGKPDSPQCTFGTTFRARIEARRVDDSIDTRFNGYVRLSVAQGSVVNVEGDGASGRNALLTAGVADAQIVHVSGAFGETHLVAEDIGYVPVDPATRTPACSDGIDNDGDGVIDYPGDPGCAFPNDDTETGGTFAAGSSAAMYYKLPRVDQARGGAQTPFEQQAVSIDTSSPGVNVIVTRVSTKGFFVSDVTASTPRDTSKPNDPSDPAHCDDGETICTRVKPYGGLNIFNFNVPGGVRVCDRVTYLAGTMTEFLGFAELTYPSWEVHPWVSPSAAGPGDGPCEVPDPAVLQRGGLGSDVLEAYESALVRVVKAHVASKFGPGVPGNAPTQRGQACDASTAFTFGDDATDCDFNGDGVISFAANDCEGVCVNACYGDPECGEYSQFRTRGNFRLVVAPTPANPGDPPPADGPDVAAATSADTILANAQEVPSLAVPTMRGKRIAAFTGTLANFARGKQNWTIEARCADDIVLCADADDETCRQAPAAVVPSQSACVSARTRSDNNAESN